ncbi:MAG TPA: carboxymuconolactone decarboxylase family protein [Rhodospirillaceae bacterium]|nr:carboxymuconolactone decarboxylase [Rhodospirillaceae bacterium]HAA91290.1 carboxymuconolactone decarboxylase family protein [Rhodospirillaceae bacterium]HAT36471.1 carboxymuconolactone decarboxylase family protein [Rhodospirillaceae bacterium]
MARIPYPDLSQLPQDVQDLAARIDPMLNVFRMLPYAESAYYGFMKFGNALLLKSALDPVLREIMILRVGYLSSAGYEIYQHEKIAGHVGMSDEKIAALPQGENSDVFDDLENLVIRFTDEIVHDVKASNATFEALAEEFDHRQMNEAVLTVGFYMMVCRYLENFEIEIEEESDVDPTLNFAPKS